MTGHEQAPNKEIQVRRLCMHCLIEGREYLLTLSASTGLRGQGRNCLSLMTVPQPSFSCFGTAHSWKIRNNNCGRMIGICKDYIEQVAYIQDSACALQPIMS